MGMVSSEQIFDFYNRGYIILRDIFSVGEIEEMRAGIDRLQQMSQGIETEKMRNGSKFVVQNGLLERVVWAGAAEPVLLKYGRDLRLSSLARQILESDQANHLINQVHFKLPGGGFYPWHQDSAHRGYGTSDWLDVNGKGSYVQIVTAIDEATMENGPLLFIPFSCGSGHLSLPYDKNRQTFSEKFNSADAVTALMQPGDVALFGPYTVHGSETNNSDKPRRIFINGYAFPEANKKVYPGEGAGELVKLVQNQ